MQLDSQTTNVNTNTINDLKVNVPSSAKTSKQHLNKPATSFNVNSSPKNDDKKLETIIQTNKIPHPPPQSTRPTSSSARKIRLSSVVKNNSNQVVPSQEVISLTNLGNKSNKNITSNGFTNGDSSNEEDVHNSSSKTIFDYNANNGQILNAYSNNVLAKYVTCH